MNLQSLLHSAIHVIFDNILAEKYVHRKSSTWNLKMNRELVKSSFRLAVEKSQNQNYHSGYS